MAFKRKFAPALINSANVKALTTQTQQTIDDGTAKSNLVAKKDLQQDTQYFYSFNKHAFKSFGLIYGVK